MLDGDMGELLLICIVGLIVLGPERLPVAIRAVTRWVRTLRSMADSLKSQLSEELKLQELQNDLNKASELKSTLKSKVDVAPELRETLEDLKKRF